MIYIILALVKVQVLCTQKYEPYMLTYVELYKVRLLIFVYLLFLFFN